MLARAIVRTADPADRRFEIAVMDSTGHRHTLLDGLEGVERATWIAAKLEWALGFEEGQES